MASFAACWNFSSTRKGWHHPGNFLDHPMHGIALSGFSCFFFAFAFAFAIIISPCKKK
jgi:hypothetical protein